MGLVASLISALKAEVEWLITSLAVASGSDDGTIASDTQTANATGAAHRDNSAPDSHAPISALAEQQPDNNADHSSALHAHSDDGRNAGAVAQLTDVETHSPANLLANADFLIDTTDNSSPATSPGLTPTSLGQTDFDLSGVSTPVGTSTHDQDFHFSPIATDSHVGIIQPHSGVGEFTLASLTPQMLGGFAHGHGGGGGGGGGTPPPAYNSYNGAPVSSVSSTGFTLTLNFDSSVATAPTAFVADMQSVADFFTKYYTTPNETHVTINVGFGEVAGTGLGSALGESEAYYVQVPITSGHTTQFQSLQAAFNSLNGNPHVTLPTNISGGDPVSGTHQYWVTTAEGKALGFANAQTQSLDGSVGFAGGSTTFDYNPTDGIIGYDFIGVATHEISEVMGRVTLNGAKDFGHGIADYSPLDLFHWLDNSSPASHTFSGTTGGYFSLDGSTSAADGYKEFNTSSSGDFSDWAVSNPPDAYDWSGGKGMPSPVTYADFLVMEAVGWEGSSSGPTSTTWTWDGV